MTITDIIDKKIKNEILTENEIRFFIKGYMDGEVKEYHAAALVTAIKLNGMNNEETTHLTMAMAESGKTLDFSEVSEIIFDKHSTGGVGDKVTIAFVPILASMGYKISKMSGRSLGYTGGTIDKLESIPDFNVDIPIEKIKRGIRRVGAAMVSQTSELAPADKQIYNLRDKIACTESAPLIASSIMSKKIASGATNLVLEVTYGKGAFMKTKKEATNLKKLMEDIGKLAGIKVSAVLTEMNEPIGLTVGNSLEVLEAIAFLDGEKIKDLQKTVEDLIVKAIKQIDSKKKKAEILEEMYKVLDSKEALEKFKQIVRIQGGSFTGFLRECGKQNLQTGDNVYVVKSTKNGIITEVDPLKISKAAFISGAGKIKDGDDIDHFSGIGLNKKTGNKIKKDEVLAYIYIGDKTMKNTKSVDDLVNKIAEEISSAYEIKNNSK